MSFTVDDILTEREIGSIVPLVVEIEKEQDIEEIPIMFVKDYKQTLDTFKDDESISIKGSIIEKNNVALMLIMIMFGKSYETTYDVWFDYGFVMHKEFIDKSLKESRIILDFRDEENNRIKTIEIENTLKKQMEDYIEKSSESIMIKEPINEKVIGLVKKSKFQIWNDELVFNLMDDVFDEYESIEELWDSM